MSLDPESPSPSTSRDWFFPSPSFIHQNRTPTRRFSTNPRPRRTHASEPKPTSFQSSLSPPGSIPPRDPKYVGLRRRIDFARRREKSPPKPNDRNGGVLGGDSEKCDVVSREKASTGKIFAGFGSGRLKVRWQMAFSLAVS